MPTSTLLSTDPSHLELELLQDADCGAESEAHGIQTATILTRNAFNSLDDACRPPQYGVLGTILAIHNSTTVTSATASVVPDSKRLYINTNAPFSAVVCGVQGSGKSHTVSTLLEDMLIPNHRPIGVLKTPLSALVLHIGEGGSSSRPSEAAFLGVSKHTHIQTPSVRVFVTRSFLKTMKNIYANIGGKITVEPLLLHESELDAEAFLSMMAVGSSNGAPLYMQIVLSILRDLGETFTYSAFMKRLQALKSTLNTAQVSGLEQRLSLLTPFIMNQEADKRSFKARGGRFAPGQVTIVDLSDPFVDPPSACALFNTVTRLFSRTFVGTGKVLLVDEAHKYLSSDDTGSGLCKTLIQINREQRHLGMRLLVSTQEPTVIPPQLLDLCPLTIVHRFSSPTWWEHLKKHVSANLSSNEAFDEVVKLKTGQAIVLCPTGLKTSETADDEGDIMAFGRLFMTVKIRNRITSDGGASVLAVSSEK